jgi:hypothetical protein
MASRIKASLSDGLLVVTGLTEPNYLSLERGFRLLGQKNSISMNYRRMIEDGRMEFGKGYSPRELGWFKTFVESCIHRTVSIVEEEYVGMERSFMITPAHPIQDLLSVWRESSSGDRKYFQVGVDFAIDLAKGFLTFPPDSGCGGQAVKVQYSTEIDSIQVNHVPMFAEIRNRTGTNDAGYDSDQRLAESYARIFQRPSNFINSDSTGPPFVAEGNGAENNVPSVGGRIVAGEPPVTAVRVSEKTGRPLRMIGFDSEGTESQEKKE